MPAAAIKRYQSERVVENRQIAPDLYLLSYPRRHDFIPGQTVALTVDRSVPVRFYSIASGTSDDLVEVLYDLVPEGELTPKLAGLRPGDSILASVPFGIFGDWDGPSWWVAGGTGVAPFASMVRSGMLKGKRLIHGSRKVESLYLRRYFEDVLGDCYVPCCSREEADGVYLGRPLDWLTRNYLPTQARYLVCGGTQMVVAVRDSLIEAGIPFGNVIAEIYF